MRIMKKNIYRFLAAICIALNFTMVPVMAADNVTTVSAEPRFNNIGSAVLTMGFDSNYVGYFSISLAPYAHCTGMSGALNLYDENGNILAGWAITDYESPYGVERTYQCEKGKTYTVTFQGYAYGEGTMFDDILLSVTDVCE